jgi:LysR family transcriptional regulator, glycine cleavage system transcriptional activator
LANVFRDLPPLNAIRAFEAAARHLSFSRAADELSVTQGAISKQIKMLESRLEVNLFDRRNGRVGLTEQGLEYLPAVTAALDSLAVATRNIASGRESQQILCIDVIPSLASLWLIPRLHGFHKIQPHIQVELTAGDGAINFANSTADLAIRCLHQSQAPTTAKLLFEERLLLVATNEFLRKHPITELKDISRQRVIPQTTRPFLWEQFLNGLGTGQQRLKFAMKSEHFFISLQSVKASLGLGLIPEFLIREELATGELNHVLNLDYNSHYGYFVLSPGYKINLHKVQCFVGWLERQIRITRKPRSDH